VHIAADTDARFLQQLLLARSQWHAKVRAPIDECVDARPGPHQKQAENVALSGV
jgi:hypothetical protein